MAYIAAGLLSIGIVGGVLRLQDADLGVPLQYTGDSLFYSALIKGIIDNGWYFPNGFLGMPWPSDLRDFPIPDSVNIFLIKLATIFTSNYGLIINLFFLATFPATTLTALYAFRQFNVSAPPALLGSLLYTFVPYHFARGQHHLMYSAYWAIPLIVLVMLWTCSEEVVGGRRLAFSLAVCALIASTGGVYYSFFACYLLVVIGLFVTIRRRQCRRACMPLLLALAICATLLVNLSPSILYRMTHGTTETAKRVPAEAEVYGLKIAQLLLPVTDHRIGALARLKYRYNGNPLVNENDDATLGVVGAFGFLLLLGWLLAKGMGVTRDTGEAAEVLGYLSVLNIAAVLLGTIGGLGAIFSVIVSPQIRGYNRISIYISFFSIFAVVLLLERVARRAGPTRVGRTAFAVCVGLLACLGLLDETSLRAVPNYGRVRADYMSDAMFVKQIEETVTPGTMIFQLPVLTFPEHGPHEGMNDYDHLRGYLHSRTLRWSYGAMRGRPGDLWQREVAAGPSDDLVESVVRAGFGGIYLDRFGYEDGGARIEGALRKVLGIQPIVSANGRLAFYNLAARREEAKGRLTEKKFDAMPGLIVVRSMSVDWKSGCHGVEGAGDESWRWCGATSELRIDNRSAQHRRVVIQGRFAAAQEAKVNVQGELLKTEFKVGPTPRSESLTVEVPPGVFTLTFTCDAPRIMAASDPRELVLRVVGFNVRVLD